MARRKKRWKVVNIEEVKEVQLLEGCFTLQDLDEAAQKEFPDCSLEHLQITTTRKAGENNGHPVYHLRKLE